MRNTFRLIVILVCAGLASCQKPLEKPDPIDNTFKDSVTLLSRLLSFDPTTSYGDTAFAYDFIYDSLRRVTNIKEYEYNNNVSTLNSVSTFYYKGKDSLPFKNTYEEIGNSQVDMAFYFYDNSQRLIKDSALYYANGIVQLYTNSYTYSPGMIISSDADTAYIGSDGNITKTVSYDPGIGHLVTTYFEYDTHPNPFYLVNIHYASSPILNFYSDIDYDNMQKNNLLLQSNHDILFAGDEQNTSNVFTYNASGLPETVNSYADGDIYERLVYVYKKM